MKSKIKQFLIILAEEIIETEEEEDSAVAFKKAGSEASEPDVTKFKVFMILRVKISICQFEYFFINLFFYVRYVVERYN